MSKIPKDIQDKITAQTKLYGAEEGPTIDGLISEGSLTFSDLQNACEVDFEAGAEYGYSLSLDRIAELEKEVAKFKTQITELLKLVV